MLGSTVFIYALLEHVRLYMEEIEVPPADGIERFAVSSTNQRL